MCNFVWCCRKIILKLINLGSERIQNRKIGPWLYVKGSILRVAKQRAEICPDCFCYNIAVGEQMFEGFSLFYTCMPPPRPTPNWPSWWTGTMAHACEQVQVHVYYCKPCDVTSHFFRPSLHNGNVSIPKNISKINGRDLIQGQLSYRNLIVLRELKPTQFLCTLSSLQEYPKQVYAYRIPAFKSTVQCLSGILCQANLKNSTSIDHFKRNFKNVFLEQFLNSG